MGFRALKSMGWQWNKTRRTDPRRLSRHWLVLSVETLLTLAYGSRVEDAANLGREPANLRAPPKCLSETHRSAHSSPERSVSVLRLGTAWLRRLLNKGRVWKRVWLLPEQWPKPPPGMKIIRHEAPSVTDTYPSQLPLGEGEGEGDQLGSLPLHNSEQSPEEPFEIVSDHGMTLPISYVLRYCLNSPTEIIGDAAREVNDGVQVRPASETAMV